MAHIDYKMVIYKEPNGDIQGHVLEMGMSTANTEKPYRELTGEVLSLLINGTIEAIAEELIKNFDDHAEQLKRVKEASSLEEDRPDHPYINHITRRTDFHLDRFKLFSKVAHNPIATIYKPVTHDLTGTFLISLTAYNGIPDNKNMPKPKRRKRNIKVDKVKL